jgi:hypothetical protein
MRKLSSIRGVFKCRYFVGHIASLLFHFHKSSGIQLTSTVFVTVTRYQNARLDVVFAFGGGVRDAESEPTVGRFDPVLGIYQGGKDNYWGTGYGQDFGGHPRRFGQGGQAEQHSISCRCGEQGADSWRHDQKGTDHGPRRRESRLIRSIGPSTISSRTDWFHLVPVNGPHQHQANCRQSRTYSSGHDAFEATTGKFWRAFQSSYVQSSRPGPRHGTKPIERDQRCSESSNPGVLEAGERHHHHEAKTTDYRYWITHQWNDQRKHFKWERQGQVSAKIEVSTAVDWTKGALNSKCRDE